MKIIVEIEENIELTNDIKKNIVSGAEMLGFHVVNVRCSK